MNPKHPVYIISKGRAESRLTSKALEKIGVPYHIVVEPQEYDEYAAAGIAPEKIIKLPFSNLGQGSIPARNFVWDHATAAGAKWHWILDDNLRRFCRMNRNMKIQVHNGSMFRAAEDFVERYENVAEAGFQYYMFAVRRVKMPVMYLNTRVYSCILLRNDIQYRWRGRYNEDTDLSIRLLKDGWCTVLFNCFLAEKMQTMTMKGGNMEELYQGDGRVKMAESLVEQHPDIVTTHERWGRVQHLVDYSEFQKHNRLKRRKDVVIQKGTNNYGMVLQDLIGGRWVTRPEDVGEGNAVEAEPEVGEG